MDVLSWNEILNNFDMSVKKNEFIKNNGIGFFVSHSAHKIDKLKNIMNKLNCNTAHLYFNITTASKTFGNHNDSMDVYFWQCQGKSIWKIENSMDFTLEPGDLIFVPKNIWHNVIPLTPRAGISFSKD